MSILGASSLAVQEILFPGLPPCQACQSGKVGDGAVGKSPRRFCSPISIRACSHTSPLELPASLLFLVSFPRVSSSDFLCHSGSGTRDSLLLAVALWISDEGGGELLGEMNACSFRSRTFSYRLRGASASHVGLGSRRGRGKPGDPRDCRFCCSASTGLGMMRDPAVLRD